MRSDGRVKLAINEAEEKNLCWCKKWDGRGRTIRCVALERRRCEWAKLMGVVVG